MTIIIMSLYLEQRVVHAAVEVLCPGHLDGVWSGGQGLEVARALRTTSAHQLQRGARRAHRVSCAANEGPVVSGLDGAHAKHRLVEVVADLFRRFLNKR